MPRVDRLGDDSHATRVDANIQVLDRGNLYLAAVEALRVVTDERQEVILHLEPDFRHGLEVVAGRRAHHCERLGFFSLRQVLGGRRQENDHRQAQQDGREYGRCAPPRRTDQRIDPCNDGVSEPASDGLTRAAKFETCARRRYQRDRNQHGGEDRCRNCDRNIRVQLPCFFDDKQHRRKDENRRQCRREYGRPHVPHTLDG